MIGSAGRTMPFIHYLLHAVITPVCYVNLLKPNNITNDIPSLMRCNAIATILCGALALIYIVAHVRATSLGNNNRPNSDLLSNLD